MGGPWTVKVMQRGSKMRSLLKWNLVVLALAVGLTCGTGALADTFSFTYVSGGVTASGTLTGTSIGGGVYDITSGTVTLTGAPISGSGSLVLNPNAPGTYNAYVGGGTILTYDNLLFQGSNPPIDSNGLLFDIGGIDVNIWGNGPGSFTLFEGNYIFSDSGSLTVPEPSVLSLLTLGLAG